MSLREAARAGRVLKVLLTVLVVTIVAAAVWALRPQRICSVPTTKTFAAHRVTLESVSAQPDGTVAATLVVHPYQHQRLASIGSTHIVNGSGVKRIWMTTVKDHTALIRLVFMPLPGKTSFSIRQDLNYNSWPKRIAWSFTSISPTATPMKLSRGGMTVVLRKIHINRPVYSNRNHLGAYRWICRQLGLGSDVPGTKYYAVELELPTPDGVRISWDCVLRDDQGNVLTASNRYFDRYVADAERVRVMHGQTGPNAVERLVGGANANLGSRLYVRRWRLAERGISREVALFAFPEMSNPPKKISVTISAPFPQPGGSSVLAQFDQVPLPLHNSKSP